MNELFNSIPASVWLLISAVIVSLIGVWFSRKKVASEVADKITLAAGRNIEVYEKRLVQSEQRITSVEHDLKVYSEALHDLETQHEALQAKMYQWHEGIQILIKQVERHDSKPDWRPDRID